MKSSKSPRARRTREVHSDLSDSEEEEYRSSRRTPRRTPRSRRHPSRDNSEEEQNNKLKTPKNKPEDTSETPLRRRIHIDDDKE